MVADGQNASVEGIVYNYNLCTSDFPGRGIAEATLFKN